MIQTLVQAGLRAAGHVQLEGWRLPADALALNHPRPRPRLLKRVTPAEK